MDSSLLVHTAEYEIRAGEIDKFGKTTVPALLQLMQETSLKHIIKLKASMWDLKDSSWVLLSKKLVINRLPSLGEKISIYTYPAGVKRIYAFRDYWVRDAQGELIAKAATTWTLMDLTSRKIVPIPIPITQLPIPETTDILQRASTSLRLPDVSYNSSEFRIGYFHLDWNNHVNNVHFARFMMETVESLFESYTPHEVHIVFRGEALIEDQLKVLSNIDLNSLSTAHRIISPDGKDISLAQIHWRPKN